MNKSGLVMVAAAMTIEMITAAGCGPRTEPVDGAGGLPTDKNYYVELALFNDNTLYRHWETGTETHTGALFNTMSGFFMNSADLTGKVVITPILIEQVTFAEKDPFKVTLDSNGQVNQYDLLINFTNYIKSLPAEKKRFDAAILLSGLTFNQPALEASFLGGVCQDGMNLGVVQVNHYNNDPFDAAILSKSLGRILGFCNDPPAARATGSCAVLQTSNPDTACASRIMEASFEPSNPPSKFSVCSGEDFLFRLSLGYSTCMTYPTGIVK